MAISKRLSRKQFDQAAKRTRLQPRGIEIARTVMVEGKTQVAAAEAFTIKPPSVSRYVSTVWNSHVQGEALPVGFEEVTAILATNKIPVVRTWEAEARIDRLKQSMGK